METTLDLIAPATRPVLCSLELAQEPGPPLAPGGESPMTHPATAVLVFVGLMYLILVW
jgi:hypothetical protein